MGAAAGLAEAGRVLIILVAWEFELNGHVFLQVKQEIRPSVSATSSSSFSVQLTKVCSFFELNILAIDCMRNTCLDP